MEREELQLMGLETLYEKYMPYKMPMEHVNRINSKKGVYRKGKEMLIEYILHFNLEEVNERKWLAKSE